ncbi:MAG TPA: ABC transporter ATP-binding protein [Acetobacteraceae bacterium]|nr:ABC transporter ATP-binding protein [Acetobacteraceae bacterium]
MTRLVLRGLRSALAGPFDMAVEAGECVAISGPSGAGKSLFLRMIADLDPNEGEVWLDGRERRSWAAPAWRRQAVYAAAEPGWWAERVCDHFAPAAEAAARALLPALDLAPAMMDAALTRLSTGERQRLALVRALVLDPPVLLLDEPTGALDQEATARIEAVLRARLARGTAVLIVTHGAGQAARLGRRTLRMAAGRLEAT